MLVKPESHSDTDSTVAVESSDVETVESSSVEVSSTQVDEVDLESTEVNDANVIVKGSFIDLDDQCLQRQYRKLRRIMSDSILTGWMDIPEVYEAGKFSREWAQKKQPVDEKPKEKSECGKKSSGKKDSSQEQDSQEHTTIMLRNLPNNYTRDMFLALLDEQGLAGLYNFVYLPCDFYRDANLGYAFVNLVDSEAVARAWKTFDGFSGWSLPTSKVCQVGWSGPHQGFKAHVERYRNSPVMHKSVPDTYKPVIFKNGIRKAFPRPTKKVKAPLGTFR